MGRRIEPADVYLRAAIYGSISLICALLALASGLTSGWVHTLLGITTIIVALGGLIVMLLDRPGRSKRR